MSPSRLVVASILFFAGSMVLALAPHSRDREISQGILVWSMFITGPFFIRFSTAPDALPELPEGVPQSRHPWHAPLTSHGGGRGLVLLLVSLLWLFGCHLLGRLLPSRPTPVFRYEDTTQLAMFFMYCWMYVAVPSTLLPERARSDTWVPRLVLVAAVVGSWFLGFWTDLFGLEELNDVFLPFEMVERVKRDGSITERGQLAFKVLCAGFVASLLFATPRMLRGIREVRPSRR